MAAVAGDARDPHGRDRARRDRPDPARDAHARLLDALDRGPGQGGDRQHAGGGDGRRGRLLGLRLRLRHGPRLHHQRDGQARAGHRRRAADPLPRLHRPQHLHPVRRRRRRGRAVRLGRARRGTRHRDDHRAAGRVHDLAARRRGEEPAIGRDHRPRRALRPDGGQGDLPVRDPDAGHHGADRDPEGRARARPTSTCSSRTRPTSGSSRRSPRASTCRWSGCSSTSTSTATRRPRPCRSPWPRRSTRAGSRSATGSSSSPSGRASRRAPSTIEWTADPARGIAGDAAVDPADITVRLPVDWDSVDPIPEALAELMRQPGPGRRPARRRRARASPSQRPPGGPAHDRPDRQDRARDRRLARHRAGDRDPARDPGRRRRVHLQGQRRGRRRDRRRPSRRSADARSPSRATLASPRPPKASSRPSSRPSARSTSWSTTPASPATT